MGLYACRRAKRLLSAAGLLGLLLGASVPAAGAPPVGFPLLSSQASPVTGAVTISAPVVLPEPGLVGVQFKVDGYVLDALDTTPPFQVVWSAASATDGTHVVTAEVQLTSGAVIESAPLVLTVANPATFNRTLHVDAAGGNDDGDGLTPGTAWRTLDRANAAVAAGDTVRLRGIFFAQSIAPNVSGTAARPIRFQSYPGETAVLDGGRSAGSGRPVVAVWLDGRSYVVVERLWIQNVAGYGVQISSGGHHNVVRDAYLTRCGTPSVWGHAIRISESSDNLIERNQIVDIGDERANSGDSIYIVSGAHRNRILNNTLQDAGHSLIGMGSQQSTAMSSDNVIADNTLSNFYATVIILAYGSERTLIEYNRISDAGRNGVNFPRPGIQMQARDNIIRYNEIFDNAAAGIDIAAYVFNGTIPQDSIGNQIYHNVVYSNNRIQDWVNNSGAINITEANDRSVRDNVIANNIFFRNDGFAYQGNNYAITINHYGNSTAWPLGSLNGNRIENNIVLRRPGVVGAPTVLRIRNPAQGGNVAQTLAAFQQTYAGASGNLETDPMFTDEANLVFTLRAGSPAIDRGLLIPRVPYLGTGPDLGVFEHDGDGPADTTPPLVAVASPAGGQTVSGVVTIRASASDNVGVTRIDYLQDGQAVAVFSPPVFTAAWNTALVPNGAHTLIAVARDAAGNRTTSAAISVTVLNTDTSAPAVTITSPTSGSTYSTGVSSITLGGTAFDNVGATQVTWTNSRGGSGTATGRASWTASGIALQPGTNVLTVTASDAAGNTATDIVTVTRIDATAPAVTITSPTAGPTYTTAASSITLGGTTSDDVGVTQVTWTNSRGGSGAAIGTTSWAVNGIALQPGANVLSVTARDAAGNTAMDTVTVTLTAAFTFTDDPLVARNTLVKAVHITELRTAIDSLRQARGLAPFAWTDRTLAPGITPARAVHVTELRTALDQAYQASRQAPPTYVDPALARTTIKKVHLDELRAAVLGLR
jgi:Big-like domain-containing protein/parallel beta helix pectate lyase-like protein